MKRYIEKLVRDKIPERIARDGTRPITRILSPLRLRAELREKLVEEAIEVRNTNGNRHQLEELADVYEVLNELALRCGAGMAGVRKVATAKRRANGGFKKGIYLIRTETP